MAGPMTHAQLAGSMGVGPRNSTAASRKGLCDLDRVFGKAGNYIFFGKRYI